MKPCPSNDCHGVFLFLRYYGVICSHHLVELTGGRESGLMALYEQARSEYFEGLGLA